MGNPKNNVEHVRPTLVSRQAISGGSLIDVKTRHSILDFCDPAGEGMQFPLDQREAIQQRGSVFIAKVPVRRDYR